jgi:hypothetical protein
MRTLSLLLPLLSASLVTSTSFSILSGDQATLESPFKVPGANPLRV